MEFAFQLFQYSLKFIIMFAVAVAGVLLGKTVRSKKDAKKAEE